MYLLFFLVPFLLWIAGASYCVYKTRNSKTRNREEFMGNTSYEASQFLSVIFTALVCVFMFSTMLYTYSNQRANFNNLENLLERRQIYIGKMKTMTEQYQEVLVKGYSSYEQNIFANIPPEDVGKLNSLLVAYPQLRASVTISAYADNIKALNDDIYNTDLQIRDLVRDIRWNYINPWIITFFTPRVPPHLEEYMH